ncbi:MAG: gliding motility-associated C-terminal domain-containing protein [Solitalea-like symbiont of Acarus siro]
MAINTNRAIEININTVKDNNVPIINPMAEPPGGFRVVDLAPNANCSLTGLNFTDNSRYIGQIIFADSYWIIGLSSQAGLPRKVAYKKILEFNDFYGSINKDGTATSYDIGLYVAITDTLGKKIIYENKAILTKVIYKTPSVVIQDVSLEDRCILTPKKPLQFGSSNESLGMQVAEEYYGPGVEFENGIYFFNPEKAGVGEQTVYYSVKSLMEGSTCKRIVSRTIRVHPALLIEGKEEVQINTRESMYKTKMNIRVQDPENRLVEYEWSPVIGLSNPKELTPEVVISNDISYKLIAKVINGDNAYNCIQEKIITFRIIPCIDKVRPISNYITPNSDGINDTWVIEGIEKYDHSIIKIYNRSGQLIWASKGYDYPWKGEHKSGQVIPGTYYYTLDLGVNVLNSTDSQCPSLYTGFIQVVK